MTTTSDSILITTAQAGQELGRDPSQVRRYCEQGRIVGAKRLGRDWMIPSPIVFKEGLSPSRPGPVPRPQETEETPV